MTRIFFISVVLALTVSCSPDVEKIPEKVPVEPAHKTVDLSSGGLPLIAEFPAESKTQIDPNWNETFGRMEVSNDLGIEIFITQDKKYCAEKKQEIESGVFEIVYAVETDSLISYKAQLPGGNSEYWHVYACFELAGESYCFENNPLIEYNKSQAAFMVDFIGYVKPKKGD